MEEEGGKGKGVIRQSFPLIVVASAGDSGKRTRLPSWRRVTAPTASP